MRCSLSPLGRRPGRTLSDARPLGNRHPASARLPGSGNLGGKKERNNSVWSRNIATIRPLFDQSSLQNAGERLHGVAEHSHPHNRTAPSRMLASASSLLVPLVLSTSLGTATPVASLHHEVRAFVTGYNTIPGQTDSTPCIAASGANICGRRDAVACPRRIGLGTTVEINGSTYTCEDRLAKKFDDRFDISCDKDAACPPQVTGWATIKVYGEEKPVPPAQPTTVVASNTPRPTAAKTAHSAPVLVFPARALAVLSKIAQTRGAPAQPAPAAVAQAGPTTVAQRLAKLASLAKDPTMLAHDAFVRRVAAAARASSGVPQRLASTVKTAVVLRGHG